MKLSILIPAYHEERTIGEVLRRVLAVATGEFAKEIIVCDDGSRDRTASEIRDVAAAHPEVQLVQHPANRGKGAAIRTALEHATGDFVLIQDADLEYDVEDYPAMLEAVRAGADVVYGSRFLGGAFGRVHLYHHYLGNRLLTTLCNLVTNMNLTDMETCYKVFRADVARRLDLRSRSFAVEPEITCKVAHMRMRVYEVPIRYAGRDFEAGKKIRARDGLIALWAIVRWGLFH